MKRSTYCWPSGGSGADTLFGDSQDDILVAGSTIHDTDEAALTAILADWVSGNGYDLRVSNIRTGTGLSTGFALNNTTVTQDALPDILFGNLDRDWFLLGAGDNLRDRLGNELLN